MSTKAQAFRTKQQRDAKPPKPKRAPRKRRDLIVDTSLPGVSATNRKAARGASGSRNASARAGKKGGAALESSTGKPSRKSTRKSAGRVKRTTNKQLAAIRKTRSPSARAKRAGARSSRR